MDALQEAILRCKLQLKFDNQTEGQGNCFPYAIVQQCRRPEIKGWLQENKQAAIFTSNQTVRNRVVNFALKSRLPIVANYKSNYGKVNSEPWSVYWNRMAKDKTWVDSHFVQLTAWYIELDILILTPSSKRGNPFIKIQGNISNMEENASGPPLLLGNYTNIHYQSLLPIEIAQTLQLKPMKATVANQDLEN